MDRIYSKELSAAENAVKVRCGFWLHACTERTYIYKHSQHTLSFLIKHYNSQKNEK